MDEQRFNKVERVMDELTGAVDEIRELAQELLSAKGISDNCKNLADHILQETEFVADAADTIYAQCEESYAEGEELVDTEVYARVLDRLPMAHQASSRGGHGYWFPRHRCVEI